MSLSRFLEPEHCLVVAGHTAPIGENESYDDAPGHEVPGWVLRVIFYGVGAVVLGLTVRAVLRVAEGTASSLDLSFVLGASVVAVALAWEQWRARHEIDDEAPLADFLFGWAALALGMLPFMVERYRWPAVVCQQLVIAGSLTFFALRRRRRAVVADDYDDPE